MSMYPNNLVTRNSENRVCTALGIKLISAPAINQIAKHAGYDSIFVDLEHSTLSLDQASSLCVNALTIGVTPFVRVPHQCGDGFVARVLDGGAMGAIFPHISNKKEAQDAIHISKYPPIGGRSLTGQLPQFGIAPTPANIVVEEINARGSSVFLMIESKEGLKNVEEIAAVPGSDVLLIGSNDLAVELGVPGHFDEKIFQDALKTVSQAAKAHGKIFGIAGLYDRKDILDRAINELGARYLLAQLDAGLLMSAAMANAATAQSIQKDIMMPGLPKE